VPVAVKHAASVSSIAFSPAAPHDYAVAAGARVGVFDARRNAEARAFSRFKEAVNAVAWRADGRLLAAAVGGGGGAGGKGTVAALDATTRATLRTFHGHAAPARAVGWVRGGGAGALVFSAGDDAALRLWDVATGACVAARERAHGDYVRASAAPPQGGGGLLGGAVLATGSYDHTVRLWDVRALGGGGAAAGGEAGGAAEGGEGDGGSDDGECAGAGADDDGDDDDSDSDGDGGGGGGDDDDDDDSSAAAAADAAAGGLSGASSRGALDVRAARGGSFSLSSAAGAGCVLSVDHGEPVTSVVLLRGGAALASAGGTTVKVWDVLGGGRLLASFSSHAKLVTAAALDGSGARLLTAALDGALKVHDAATWSVVHTARFPGAALVAVGMAPDNSRFAVGAADGTLWVRARALRLGDALLERRDAAAARAGSLRYFLRGRGARADDGGGGGAGGGGGGGAGARKPRLRPFERALKAFAHGEALDAALAGAPPPVLAALLRELLARGALGGALAGRGAAALEPLLAFLASHVAHPRYAAVCVDVADVVADTFAPALAPGGAGGGDAALAALLAGALGKVAAAARAELVLGDALLGLQGQLDTLLAAAPAGVA